MGAGGRGGDGGKGGNAGRGGDGGNGGLVSVKIAHNAGFVIRQIDVAGGAPAANGRAGLRGAGGQQGGGHGTRGPGGAGTDGSPVVETPKAGKRGRIDLHGVTVPNGRSTSTPCLTRGKTSGLVSRRVRGRVFDNGYFRPDFL